MVLTQTLSSAIRLLTSTVLTHIMILSSGLGDGGSASAAPRSASPKPQAVAAETAKPATSGGQAKRVKFKKDTKVDFDDELIEGGVKNPFSSMINSRDGDNKSGFVRIRKEWHDQMIMSINGLNQ